MKFSEQWLRSWVNPSVSRDELVARLPPAVRETLDELFRARFVRVTRLPRKTLTAAKG